MTRIASSCLICLSLIVYGPVPVFAEEINKAPEKKDIPAAAPAANPDAKPAAGTNPAPGTSVPAPAGATTATGNTTEKAPAKPDPKKKNPPWYAPNADFVQAMNNPK